MFFENPYREAIPGQWIKNWTGTVFHHGIVSGFWLNPATNKWSIMVTHTTMRHGRVENTTLDEFGYRTVEIVAQPASIAHQEMILATAQVNVGKPYAVLNMNCEHFASHCHTHKAESRQVKDIVVLLGLVGAAALVVKSMRTQ